MLYVIHAYDQIYGGLHGIEDWSIADCSTINEAEEYLRENSMDIITSYSSIIDQLEADVEDYKTDDMSEEEIEELRYDIYNEDIDGNIYQIKKEFSENYTSKDFLKFEQELVEDPEEFIKTYCIL